MLTTVFPSLKSHDDTAELRRAARAMSATTEDDGTSSEDLSNLLALADENLAGDNLADGVPRADPEIDFADDRARVAALAAIADRAAALPPYAGDDAETDAVFDELLELHASIAATDAWDAPSSLSTEPDAREARLDREALERASVLVDAIAALAGASGSAPDGVVVHADAVKRRLEWSLEEMRTKQKEAVASAQSTVRLRRDALRHALDVADGDDGADDADAVDAVETAFEDAALDAEAAAVAATRSQEARERSARLVAEGGAEGDASALASPSKASESSDDSSRSGSSLDDVIDRELRNQRFVRKQARARARQGGGGGGRGAPRGGGGGGRGGRGGRGSPRCGRTRPSGGGVGGVAFVRALFRLARTKSEQSRNKVGTKRGRLRAGARRRRRFRGEA